MALVRTYVSEERTASIIRVTRIGELGTTLAVTSNQSSQRGGRYVPPKRRFLQEPNDVISQKTAFFIASVVKTSNRINLVVFSPLATIPTGRPLLVGEVIANFCVYRDVAWSA
jgi:hypothetical protein